LVEVEKGGITFQIIGTHLQSKEGSQYQDVRNSQLKELKDLLITNKAESTPFIVIGDLNIAMNMTTDYQQMLSILDVQNGELSGDYKFTADRKTNDMYPSEEAKGKVIDYILINSMGVEIEQVNRAVKIFRTNWRKKNKDLSDHYAVEAEIVY
jgi:endonuclease/exonuclease/phosphatase family metal-dependent hydrolase